MNGSARHQFMFLLMLGLPAFIWLVPTLWMLSLSLQPNALLARTTGQTLWGMLPWPFTLDNYTQLLSHGQVHIWFWNSLVVAVGMTLGVLVLSTTAGFALARLQFRGRSVLLVFVLLGLMIPEQAVFIPLYALFSDYGWHNSYHGLIVPRLAVPIGVFIMFQFFKNVSRDVEEAARIDGANTFQIFWYVMLPLARPAMITVAILTFLYAWNDYLWPLVSAQRTEHFTITLGLASLQSNFAQSEGLGSVMASGVLASLPVVLLFLIFQKYVVKAVAVGGSKG